MLVNGASHALFNTIVGGLPSNGGPRTTRLRG
jgi:hypothetical protein